MANTGRDSVRSETVPFLPVVCMDACAHAREELNTSQVVVFQLEVYQETLLWCSGSCNYNE